ncbi:MaoC/PaaZ C-terminal domain-containing protein [Aestuariirhabdus sp. LZHN29]|uniref:MaoC/PaaZ C-terminal domain-containing protein n=1 Tax=Aestuariirhabdus sp. LZHN29 TaxID=3417462 RepID=UPI003CFAE3CC
MLVTAMPSLPPLFARALFSRKGKSVGKSCTLPELGVRVEGVKIDAAHLQDYRALVMDPGGEAGPLPICYPHLLNFPMQLSLLVAPEFPLPLLGLVHLRNRIRVLEAIDPGEVVDIECWLGAQRESGRGLEFDLHTRLSRQGTTLWQSCSVNLYRNPAMAVARARSAPDPLAPLPLRERWSLPVNMGWRYARSAGDYNPIHLHRLCARLFGFPRAIMHGMWSKARCLSTLQAQMAELPVALEVDCDFKTPLYLPGEALMSWQQEAAGEVRFLLQDSAAVKPHLTAVVRPISVQESLVPPPHPHSAEGLS